MISLHIITKNGNIYAVRRWCVLDEEALSKNFPCWAHPYLRIDGIAISSQKYVSNYLGVPHNCRSLITEQSSYNRRNPKIDII